MFVEASAPVTLPIDRACAFLLTALTEGGLVRESQRAFDAGLTAQRSVGPRGGDSLSKQVVVRTLPSRQSGATTIVPIRWEVSGVAGQLFPTLDADLCLRRVNDVTSLLSLIGRYAPPLGRAGEVIDRSVLSGLAQSSVESFVREVAASVADLAARPRSA